MIDYFMTNEALLQYVGKQMQQMRINARLSQQQLAERAGTRMTMQDEILRLWKEHNTTMVMVTHDVDEAVYLSDYVVVMSPRPAKVEKIIPIDISHPRARGQDIFLKYRTQILEILNYAGKVQEVEYAI